MSPLGDSEYIQNISYLNWFFSIDCCSNSLYFVYIKHYKSDVEKVQYITILVNYSIIIDINKCSCYNGNDGKLGLLYHLNFGYWDYK